MPSLHISLGIYSHLFKCFQAQCHDLDLQLAIHQEHIPSLASQEFRIYSAKLQLIQANEDRITALLQEATVYESVCTWMAIAEIDDDDEDSSEPHKSQKADMIEAMAKDTEDIRSRAQSLVCIYILNQINTKPCMHSCTCSLYCE